MKVVKFDTAGKLKEVGFDLPVLRWYFIESSRNTNISVEHPLTGLDWNRYKSTKRISAPYQYEVVDWLREVHNIEVFVHLRTIHVGWVVKVRDMSNTKTLFRDVLDTHTEALEQGILEAIKYIK